MIRVTSSIAIDESEIEESFIRSPGPGGQNVNKVASAVQLRFDVRARHLSDERREVAVVRQELDLLLVDIRRAPGLLDVDDRR